MSEKNITISNENNYHSFLVSLKNRIQSSEQRIEKRQADQGWGAKVIDRLASDLHNCLGLTTACCSTKSMMTKSDCFDFLTLPTIEELEGELQND